MHENTSYRTTNKNKFAENTGNQSWLIIEYYLNP